MKVSIEHLRVLANGDIDRITSLDTRVPGEDVTRAMHECASIIATTFQASPGTTETRVRVVMYDPDDDAPLLSDREEAADYHMDEGRAGQL